jgi:hypothetical protein
MNMTTEPGDGGCHVTNVYLRGYRLSHIWAPILHLSHSSDALTPMERTLRILEDLLDGSAALRLPSCR